MTERSTVKTGEKEDGVKARFFEKMATPWRVILVGDHPGRFIETELIRSLNPDVYKRQI